VRLGVSIAACLWAVTGFVAAAKDPRPNVVFILVDDLGWSDVGCYGSKAYETPHVDRLASQGMRFTDFYAAGPVCSPTRASILSGKCPARTRITRHLLTPKMDPQFMANHLALEEVTLAEALKEHGYSTGYFGKWHLGYKTEHWASHQGFDVARGGMDIPWAWELCHPDREPPTKRTWRKTHTRFFSPHHLTHLENGPDGEYLTDRLTDETMRFIEANRSDPFFVFLSFHTVHTPLEARPEIVEKYAKKIAASGLAGKREPNKRFKRWQNNPNYAAMVHHMDENVGRLLAKLTELGLEDNTLVVFTSDNGGKGSVTSNLPLNGAKHDLREGGIRVPTIVRWPGRVEAGSVCGVPLISNDFYPTILQLIRLPLKPDQHVDGVSFAPVLLGEAEGVARDALFWHYPHSRFEGAVRAGGWKLTCYYKSGECELHDLREDIGERRDLSGSEGRRAREMLGMLKAWLRATDAAFPESFDRRAFLGEETE
jgi:arylsulfatase A-like enzyme